MEGSLKYHLDTLAMFKAVCPGVRNCAIAGCLKNIGMAYKDLGDVNQALKYFEDAMEMERSLFSGQNHPDIAESLSELGSVSEKLGNGAAAVKYYEDALEARRALYPGQNHSDITFSLCSLGWAHEKLGNDAVALKYYEDALEMQKALDGNYNGTGWMLDQIGAIYFKLGDIEGIIKSTEQCLEMKLKFYEGRNHTLIANSFSNLGQAYESFGDRHKAAEYFKVAFLMDAETEGSPDFQGHTKEVVESKYPEFIRNGETREFLRERGSFDASTLQIKKKLQEPVLDEICEASAEGRWESDSSGNRGVKDYLEESYLRQQLGSLSSPETVEKTKMLCFEAICLGIMGSVSRTKNFTCAKEFTSAYRAVVENITRDHPEYFVDGSILRQCVNDPDVLNKLLGSAN